jgi:prolipoprotein diacylglyceryl transferase
MLASIPSPSESLKVLFSIGSLHVHTYGILMGIAVATAYIVVTRRYEKLGGDRKVAEAAGFWCIVIGFIGARLAFVAARLGYFVEHPAKIFAIWEGGIALFGGLTFGAITAIVVIRRHHGDFWIFADAISVALPAAQAIGRWGNYFNQELFGTPTSLPWGIRIDATNRPPEYAAYTTFQPTFLYEMLWNIGIIVLLLWLERHRRLRRGTLFTLYVILYAVIRFLMELMRTDTTFRFWGLSRNGWYSILVVLLGLGLLWWIHRHHPLPSAEPEQGEGEEGEAEAGGARDEGGVIEV